MQDTAIYNYGSYNFVLGSTAEVECLLSIVLMTMPLIIEVIVFLCINRDF